ncbi:MAG TPA: hypothetical protein VFS43_43375 [Polyangiaceae bacterium]|nr:hypothetical protein [Polyangiaceae bacterium]
MRWVGFALLGVFAAACGQGDETGAAGAQVIDGAAAKPDAGSAVGRAAEGARAWSGPAGVLAGECSDEELAPVGACVAAACPGLSGPEFANCAITFCQDEIFSVSSECLTCLAENQNTSAEEILAICGGDPPPPPPPEAACSLDEFDPLEACAIENCDGLEGDALASCALQFCGPEIGALSFECLNCVSGQINAGGGIDSVFDVCVAGEPPPPPPPESACVADEMDAITACVLLQCGKLQGNQLISCSLARCIDVLTSVSGECVNCMFANAGGALPGVIAACGPDAEPPPPPPPPPPACTPEELGPIEACVTAACPGLSGPELSSCALSFCQDEILSASSECLNCLSANQNGTIEEIAEACGN